MSSSAALLNSKPDLQKLSSMLPNLVSVVIVIALGYNVADFAWRYLSPDEASDTAVAPASNIPSGSVPKQTVSNITRSYLFGKPGPGAAKPIQSKTPVSRLNAQLRGVLAAVPEKYSTAIISAGKGKGSKEEAYGIGDTIQSGVKLVEIHTDHVIIQRQGKYEKLVLSKSKSAGVTAKRKTPGKQRTASSKNLGDIRREIMKNPTAFGEYALPVVVKQNGKQIGYRLKPQKKGELLSQYGLQASDIITEINGVSLSNPQSGIKALRELSTAQSVNLTVKRGNSFVPLNITLQ